MKRGRQEKKSSRSPKRQHHSEISDIEKSNGIHIPFDLITDILSRLPVKSLVKYDRWSNSCDGLFGYDPVEKQVFTLVGGTLTYKAFGITLQKQGVLVYASMKRDDPEFYELLSEVSFDELTLVNYQGKLGCIRYTKASAEMWIMEDHIEKQEWSKIIIFKKLGDSYCIAGVNPNGEIVIMPKTVISVYLLTQKEKNLSEFRPMELSQSDPTRDPDTRYDQRCCCFPSFRSRSSTAVGYSSWGRIRTVDDSNHSGDHGDEPRWWIRASLKIREWSEIVAGPRWKTFIRRFNRDPRRGRDWDASEKFQYDPLSYSLNFDDDDEDEYVGLGGLRSFSTRFASVPVYSGKAPVISPTSLPALTPRNEIIES
ncbi:unnamed protein product [Arabidopsis halleri]